MALIDFLKSPWVIADEALAEKFNYEPVSKKVTNLIPPNIRQFVYDALGGKEDFTEKDLSPSYKEELKGIATEALSKGKDKITYADYEGDTMDKSLIKNIFSKNYNLKTLIGSGKITVNENGEIIVTDKFNFNDAKDLKSLADVKNMFKGIMEAYQFNEKGYGAGHGLYSALREFAKYIGSGPGEGSDVIINLGKSDLKEV
tara:strand:- start:12 stop:614 length:603 start_codon:yes stop_codon:yes gene_type:complete